MTTLTNRGGVFLMLAVFGWAWGCSYEPAGAQRLSGIRVANDASLAARLERIRASHGVPGIGVAVLRPNGETVAVVGRRRADRETRLAPDDRFHLGSNTKAITASVVGRLVDRGMLRWDLTLAEAMPDLAAIDPALREVTLDMLMRHVAGLSRGNASPSEFDAGFDEAWPLDRQRAWLVERLVSRPPLYAPASRFAYSNDGYLIVGHVIERVSGKTWEDMVTQEVFVPLGMTACGFGPTATAARPHGNWGHDVEDGQYVPTEQDVARFVGPSGTVHCSLGSWLRFAAAHTYPAAGAWISASAINHLHEPFVPAGFKAGRGVGLGWGVVRGGPPGLKLTHNGSNGYNFSEMVVMPHLQAAVLVTCNAGDKRASQACSEIRDLLVGELLDETGRRSTSRSALDDPERE